jgi:hypothetical protein
MYKKWSKDIKDEWLPDGQRYLVPPTAGTKDEKRNTDDCPKWYFLCSLIKVYE